MLFVGIAITGGCSRGFGGFARGCSIFGGTPGQPISNPGPEPKLETDFCEMQGMFEYNTEKVLNPYALWDYLKKIDAQAVKTGKPVTVNVYGFASIDGEGKFNVRLSSKRASAIKAAIVQAQAAGFAQNIKIGKVTGYGTTEAWGIVDRNAYKSAKQKGGDTWKKFVRSNEQLKANRKYVISTRKIPNPKIGWKFTKALAGAGNSMYGNKCGETPKPPSTCGNENLDDGEECDKTATPVGCKKDQECTSQCKCQAKYMPSNLDPNVKWKDCTCPLGVIYKIVPFVGEPCGIDSSILRFIVCWIIPLLLLLLLLFLLWLLIRRLTRRPQQTQVREFPLFETKQTFRRELDRILSEKLNLRAQINPDKPFNPNEEGRKVLRGVHNRINQAQHDPHSQLRFSREFQVAGEALDRNRCMTLKEIMADKGFDNNDRGREILRKYLMAFNIPKVTVSLILTMFEEYRNAHGRDVADFDNRMHAITAQLATQNVEIHVMHEFFVLQEELLDRVKAFQAQDREGTYQFVEILGEMRPRRTWKTLWLRPKWDVRFTRNRQEHKHDPDPDQVHDLTPEHNRGGVVGGVPGQYSVEFLRDNVIVPADNVYGLCEQLRAIIARILRQHAGRQHHLHTMTDEQRINIFGNPAHNTPGLFQNELKVGERLAEEIERQEQGMQGTMSVDILNPPGLDADAARSTFNADDEVEFLAEISGGIPPFHVAWIWGNPAHPTAVLHEVHNVNPHVVRQDPFGRDVREVRLRRRLDADIPHPNGNPVNPLDPHYNELDNPEIFGVKAFVQDSADPVAQDNDSHINIRIRQVKTQGVIEGIVVDDEQPDQQVKDADVEAVDEHGRRVAGPVKSGEEKTDGYFKLEGVPLNTKVTVKAVKTPRNGDHKLAPNGNDGKGTREPIELTAAEPNRKDVIVPIKENIIGDPMWTVEGHVVDEEGEPVEKAKVDVAGNIVESDDEGHFIYTSPIGASVPPPFEVTAKHKDLADGSHMHGPRGSDGVGGRDPIQLTGPSEHRKDVVVQMHQLGKDKGTIEGDVIVEVNGDMEMIKGAMIAAVDKEGKDVCEIVESDENGHFMLEGVPLGIEVKILGVHDDYNDGSHMDKPHGDDGKGHRELIELTRDEDHRDKVIVQLKLKAKEKGIIEGDVILENAQGNMVMIPGAEVAATDGEGTELAMTVESDENGHFVITGALPDVSIVVVARHDNYKTGTHMDAPLGDDGKGGQVPIVLEGGEHRKNVIVPLKVKEKDGGDDDGKLPGINILPALNPRRLSGDRKGRGSSADHQIVQGHISQRKISDQEKGGADDLRFFLTKTVGAMKVAWVCYVMNDQGEMVSPDPFGLRIFVYKTQNDRNKKKLKVHEYKKGGTEGKLFNYQYSVLKIPKTNTFVEFDPLMSVSENAPPGNYRLILRVVDWPFTRSRLALGAEKVQDLTVLHENFIDFKVTEKK